MPISEAWCLWKATHTRCGPRRHTSRRSADNHRLHESQNCHATGHHKLLNSPESSPRLRHAFNDESNRILLDEIHNNVRDLEDLFGHQKRMARLPLRRYASAARSYASLQMEAQKLFNVLNADITAHCGCRVAHKIGLRVESRASGGSIAGHSMDPGEPRFELLLTYDAAIANKQRLPWYWRSVKFEPSAQVSPSQKYLQNNVINQGDASPGQIAPGTSAGPHTAAVKSPNNDQQTG